MKTYRQQLESLPDGWREAALKAAEEQGWNGTKPDVECKELSTAVLICFIWEETKEKHKPWDTLYDAINYNDPLPPYPFAEKVEVKEPFDKAADEWSLEKAQEFAAESFKSKCKKGTVTWESILKVLKIGVLTGHKFGTKWQAKRMYSEEQVRAAIVLASLSNTDSLIDKCDEIIQQLKKGGSNE